MIARQASLDLLHAFQAGYILRGGTNTVYELRRGEHFVWPLRFTAVVVRQADGWKFAQVNFSFPTVFFPDVRIVGR